MLAFLMHLISTNPWHGPEWLGAIADVFIICIIVFSIFSRCKKER